ncbi:MAG: polysaccharide deacetylase family protein [Bacteroidales bacterium]|nr:polysaccharide deacetylase family protein [Bacteroidales bacterium]
MLKSIIYNRFNFLPSILPLKSMISLTGQRLIMVVYHTVCDKAPVHIKHLYQPRSLSTFTDDMKFLLRYYEPIGLSRLKDRVLKNEKTTKNQFFVSFDDGLSEFYSCAAPLLKRLGIPATCFLNTAFIDNKDMFYRYKISVLIEEIQKHKDNPDFWKEFHALKDSYGIPQGYYRTVLLNLDHTSISFIHEAAKLAGLDFQEYLKTNKPYMTATQISELIQQGFTFGGHSIDHPGFKLLDDKEKIRQAVQSIREVSERFNLNYRTFAFPFTDHGISKAFFNALYAEYPIDLSFGTAGLKQDIVRRNLQRIPIEEYGLSAEKRLKTDYFYYMLKGMTGKNIIKR